MQEATGGAVTAFELVPAVGLELVLKHIPDTRSPLEGSYPWHALIELSFGDGATSRDLLESAMERAFEEELVLDAALAGSVAQAADFWKLRETLPEAEKLEGPAVKHDVSTPVSSISELIAKGSQAVLAKAPGARIIAFGHVGDGNIHFNVAPPAGAPAFDEPTRTAITEIIHNTATSLNGSISAEHGIGVMKAAELARRRPLDVELMAAIKAALDPKGIMNPRAIFG